MTFDNAFSLVVGCFAGLGLVALAWGASVLWTRLESAESSGKESLRTLRKLEQEVRVLRGLEEELRALRREVTLQEGRSAALPSPQRVVSRRRFWR